MINMKNCITLLFLAVILLSIGCKGKDTTEEVAQKPKVPVEVTNIGNGLVSDNLELFATTVYLKRNTVMAPIPAYITDVHVKLGDRVSPGQVLYELESKERKALGNTPVQFDSSLAGYGKIKVKSTGFGVVSAIDRQQAGDYVLEGTSLCTIATTGGMAFQVNVPFEFVNYTRTGNHCTIVLPDNSKHPAVFTTPLAAMNVGAQTQSILAKTSDGLVLPEGLIAKVLVSKGAGNSSQVLPKASVLSDEMMQKFWIMKLLNDSIAVKVPVIVGNKNKDEIEVLSPQFTAHDRIITNGNYGLPDTALVTIITRK
jgi:hypothetical protein